MNILSVLACLALAAPVTEGVAGAVSARLAGEFVVLTIAGGTAVEGKLVSYVDDAFIIVDSAGEVRSIGRATVLGIKVAPREVASDDRLARIEQRLTALESRKPGERVEPPAQEKAWDIPVADSPILGNAKAPITVTVFGDLQCPFCARVDPVLRDIVKDPRFKGRLKVVFKHFPLSFHVDAKKAAIAALAARSLGGDSAFWAMAEKMFQNQRELTSENFSVWAGQLGLDVAAFERISADSAAIAAGEEIIARDLALGVNTAKVRGTPSLFVNGWELKTRSAEGVMALIEERKLKL